MACSKMQTVCVCWEHGLRPSENNFAYLRRKYTRTDVTITCADGQGIRAHREVLMRSSLFFRVMLTACHLKTIDPVVMLSGIPFFYVRELINFMYESQVVIPIATMGRFMELGKMLRIRGLCSYANLCD